MRLPLVTTPCCGSRAALRTSYDTIYILVTFSEPLSLTPPFPVLALNTGRHFETLPPAATAQAAFIGGGVTTSKAFWRNDAPNPLRSGVAPPCRAGAVKSSTAFNPTTFAPATAYPSAFPGVVAPNYTYGPNSLRPEGAMYCIAGAGPEIRQEGSMDATLAFAFDVLPGHRTPWLDANSSVALTSGGAITSAATRRPARLTLPAPGNPLAGFLGAMGAANSLSASAQLVVGAPFVTSVSTPSPPLRVTAVGATVDILVSWSEPVLLLCGAANDAWAPTAASTTLITTCPLILLKMVSQPSNGLLPNGTAILVASTLAQLQPGAAGPPDPPNVLRFRYTVRAFDTSDPAAATAAAARGLQYAGAGALQFAAQAGGDLAAIVRRVDHAPAGVALPPTRFDAGGVDHPLSLAGTKTVVIAASYMPSRGSTPLPGPPPTLICAAGNVATQCTALQDFYAATNGSGWITQAGWTTAASGIATDYCTFFGVTCTGSDVTQMCVHSCRRCFGAERVLQAVAGQPAERHHPLHARQPHELDIAVRAAWERGPRRLGCAMLRLGGVRVAGPCIATN